MWPSKVPSWQWKHLSISLFCMSCECDFFQYGESMIETILHVFETLFVGLLVGRLPKRYQEPVLGFRELKPKFAVSVHQLWSVSNPGSCVLKPPVHRKKFCVWCVWCTWTETPSPLSEPRLLSKRGCEVEGEVDSAARQGYDLACKVMTRLTADSGQGMLCSGSWKVSTLYPQSLQILVGFLELGGLWGIKMGILEDTKF